MIILFFLFGNITFPKNTTIHHNDFFLFHYFYSDTDPMSTVHQIYLELERISTVLASTGGRDKVMRFIDYGTRATSYYLTTAAPNDSKTKTVKNLEAHLM